MMTAEDIRRYQKSLMEGLPAAKADAEKKSREAHVALARVAAMERMIADCELILGGRAEAPEVEQPKLFPATPRPRVRLVEAQFDALDAIDRVLREAGRPISGNEIIAGVARLAAEAGFKTPADQTIRSKMSAHKGERGWVVDKTTMPPLWSAAQRKEGADA